MVGKPEQQQEEEVWPQKTAADLTAASVRKQKANKKWVPATKPCTQQGTTSNKAPPPQPSPNSATSLRLNHFSLQRTFHIQTTKVIILYINNSMITMADQHRGMSTCLQIHRISLGEHILHFSFFLSHHCHTNGLLSLLTEANIYLSCLDLCFLVIL